MNIHQLDVTTAFLNGYLKEDILVNPPKELIELLQIFTNSDKDDDIRKKANQMLHELNTGNKVCKLRKALYELRQVDEVDIKDLTKSWRNAEQSLRIPTRICIAWDTERTSYW